MDGLGFSPCSPHVCMLSPACTRPPQCTGCPAPTAACGPSSLQQAAPARLSPAATARQQRRGVQAWGQRITGRRERRVSDVAAGTAVDQAKETTQSEETMRAPTNKAIHGTAQDQLLNLERRFSSLQRPAPPLSANSLPLQVLESNQLNSINFTPQSHHPENSSSPGPLLSAAFHKLLNSLLPVPSNSTAPPAEPVTYCPAALTPLTSSPASRPCPCPHPLQHQPQHGVLLMRRVKQLRRVHPDQLQQPMQHRLAVGRPVPALASSS